MTKRALEVHDDRPHEHGGEDGWLEQLCFVFSDPAIIGSVQATWDPIERRAEADLMLRLEDGVVVRSGAREKEMRSREETVGGFVFACVEQMKTWRLTMDLKGMLLAPLADAAVMGRSVPVRAVLEFSALADADGFGVRRRIVTPQRFASIISSGAFAQAMAVKGELRVGDRRLHLDGYGVRSRTWGVREADPSDARLFVSFDAAGAAWFDRRVLGDTEVALAGSLGAIKIPEKLAVTREDGRVARLLLGGLSAEVIGRVPDVSGKEQLFVRCRSGSSEALGIAETAAQDAEMTLAGQSDASAEAPAG